ncbi:MAG TPA: hypothetical protein VFY06_11110 [Verrucomicrobiae bacterium]|nr:hypothetical protein [Verrucomicrobiae bacterium]
MAETANRTESLRFNRRDIRRLALVLALSLLAHLLGWGAYEAAKELGVTRWLARLAPLQRKTTPTSPVPKTEPPLEFVTVDQPSTEPPKETKFYSNNNSRAANPDADRLDNVPKITGTQTDVPKTETVPKPDFNQLHPAPTPPPPANPEPPRPAPTVAPGDLTLGKPEMESPPKPEPTPPRPRTLNQARAQQQPHHTPGIAMKQSGGVPNVKLSASFDVKATPFGQYDADFVDAVQYRWYALLRSQQFALDRTGKVVLRFHLHYDGTISDMTVLENTVGVLLGYVCEEAINDPAPYKPWPEDMRRMVGKNYREVTFTFYYYY